MKRILVSVLVAIAALSAIVLASPAAIAQGVELPTQAFGESRPIPGRYIVVFKDRVTNPAAEAANLMRSRGGQIHFTYRYAIKGFAATIPDTAYQAIRMNPNIEYIEQDQTVSLSVTQSNATWGLDRIDQQDLPLSKTYEYAATGSGVYAYIIDTGIRTSHNEFIGRTAGGYTAINDGRGTNDCNGHGTHVAGTVGGTVYGVAKQVTLIPVRVLDCQGYGTMSGVIAGVDWVTQQKNSSRPMVANMSLGGGASTTLDNAVSNSIEKGVVYAVAAGNSSADACSYSPARARAPSRWARRRAPTRGLPIRTLVRVWICSHRAAASRPRGTQQHGHQDHQRHFDGLAARCGRRGAGVARQHHGYAR
jgi:aqualysin 1